MSRQTAISKCNNDQIQPQQNLTKAPHHCGLHLDNQETHTLHSPMEPTLNEKGSPPSASSSDIMLVQEAMQNCGLYSGEIDGIPGKETMRAVRSYKRQHKMPQNNAISFEFIAYLRDN